MGVESVPIVAFNRGLLSPLGLARIDIKRTAMSSEIQTNWMCRVLGSMMLRPGFGYIGGIYNNLKNIHIPFIFSTLDTAILEFTDNKMRVRVSEAIVSYPSVSTTVTNGDFGGAGSWTDTDEAGGTSTISGGLLTLVGNGSAAAIREQNVTISAPDQNIEHCLKIVVTRGPVTFSVGSTSGADDYISRTSLATGEHFLTFTPTGGSAYVRLSSTHKAQRIVDSCQISTGNLEITTNWDDDDLQSMRWDQSADVVYISCRTVPQYKVERRSTRSWSIVRYQPENGPFRIQNLSAIRLTPSAISGNITLTASSAVFKSTNVGSLYSLDSVGQIVTVSPAAADQWSNPIRVTGVGANRTIIVNRANLTGDGTTATLQYSVGEPGSWVVATTYTTDGTAGYNDGLDNQIIYYRIGVATAEHGGGTSDLTLTYASGSLTGIVRVTGYTSSTQVDAEVLTDLGGTTATLNWSEGEWSDRRGYPSAVALHEGRLFWAGKNKIWGSVSDAYEDFNPETEGDSAPISRSIGSGPVDNANFLLPLQRLIIGTDGAEWPARSTSFDEPLTASNFNLKAPSTQGSANVPGIKIDDRGLFVQRSGTKLYQLEYGKVDSSAMGYDYSSANLCELTPEVGEPSITRLAVQRQPDTRVHCVRGDGRVAVLISQPAEEVMCWLMIETDGMVEDAFVMPGTFEDSVYYSVRRRINGSTVRFLEKWALERDCRGGTQNKHADSFITYNGSATSTITGLDHLEGCSVVVWADGFDLGWYVVSGGSITLDRSVREAVVGLYFDAEFLSTKLAYAAQGGTALTKSKRIDHLGVILADTHAQGIQYGGSLRCKRNNFLYSQAFDNAKWTKTNFTATANQTTDPDGTVLADSLLETTTNGVHTVSQVVNLRQTDNNVLSVYAKPISRNYVYLKMSGDNGTVTAFFNLSTGVVVAASIDNANNASSVRAGIEEADNGFYRCWVSGICDTAGTFGVTGTIGVSTDGSTTSYAGDIAKGLYLYGAQIEIVREKFKKPSGYIATTTRPMKEYLDLNPLPEIEEGQPVDPDAIWDQYDQPGIEFPGEWQSDARMALVAQAPRPCTALAAIVDIKTSA